MDIVNVLSSIVVAVVASVLTAYLTFRKNKSEKWWDAKYKCYLDTVGALNNMVQYCDATLQENPECDEDCILALQNRFQQGRLDFERQTNIGCLLLSNEAQSCLLELDSAIYKADSEADVRKRMATIRVAVEECLDSFIINAKSDLKIK